MSNLLSLRIKWQKGTSLPQLLETLNTVNKFLFLAELSGKVEVKFGKPFSFKKKNKDAIGYVNVNKFLERMWQEQQKLDEIRYDLFCVNEDLRLQDWDKIAGVGCLKIGAIIKLRDENDVDEDDSLHNFFIRIIHELGHVFGLVPDERTENVKNSSFGGFKHCADEKCAMHPNGTRQEDKNSPLCEICLRDLRAQLKKMNLLP